MKRVYKGLISIVLCLLLCGCNVKNTFEDIVSDIQSSFLTLESGEITQEIIEEYYVVSAEYDSCYNSLNKKQKKLYSKIYSAMEMMPEGFVKLCEAYNGVASDINIAYNAVLKDKADIFWISDEYLIGKTSNFGKEYAHIAFSYSGQGKTVSYLVPLEKREEMRYQLDKKVQEVVALTEKETGQYEKEKVINDYICNNTEYNKEAEFCSTAYGCLVNKQALCEGYARAFKLICNTVGIECDLIVGRADGVAHMWNTVNIDGMHNYVDVTWNDQNSNTYAYFNITDSQIKKDHSFAPIYSSLSLEELATEDFFNFVERECTYTGNTYYKKSGSIFDFENEENYPEIAGKIISQKAKDGIYYADFLLATDSIIEEFKRDNAAFLFKIQSNAKDVVITSYFFERDVLMLFYDYDAH